MGLLLLVRHGQASFGADDYDVLSPDGVTQSWRLAAALLDQGVKPSALRHGALRRQRETAYQLTLAAGWTVAEDVDPRWDEFDHLAVMGAYPVLPPEQRERLESGALDRREFQEIFEKATTRWAAGTHDADYAETFAAFTKRVRDALSEAARLAGPGETAVVVSSGGPIAAACAMLTGVADNPRRLSAAWRRLNAVMVNSSVTRVVIGSSGARLLTFNEHTHLGGQLVTYR